ncbi:MAG TPA: molecular chaperone DnaJ [Candidatus Avipropionibacterium avicola]|uniref:Chaperone protein DnaJ n=1 Tax=Candidatus Avipropionibacterium avicola TaxID=2840701 RepID=A0A9D1GXM4_9ACTN|nr:molecular chaperone DnaJ [Candidatus Avipropionibacterium avicola]
MTQDQDYYEILEVSRDATAEEIKKAYRRKARTMHPDVATEPDAAERFKKVAQAYETLRDPQKRQMYDMGVRSGAGAGGMGGMGGMGGFSGAQGFDFTDLMGAMFGQNGANGRGPRPRVRRGQDALVRVELDLVDAAFGATKPIKIDTAVLCPRCNGQGGEGESKPEPCQTCRGQGEVTSVQRSFIGDIRTTQACPACDGYGTIIPEKCTECSGAGRIRSNRTINVKIPAGVDTGNRIHLESQGEVGPGGGPAGDLYVELVVAPHEVFKREGDDLDVVAKIPMTAAALGTEVPVATLDAERDEVDPEDASVTVTVPAGTQSGTRIVLEGWGVPKLRGTGRGKLGVTLLVQTPTKLDEGQKEALRMLAEMRDETHPEVAVQKHHRGVFGRLRDAFTN